MLFAALYVNFPTLGRVYPSAGEVESPCIDIWHISDIGCYAGRQVLRKVVSRKDETAVFVAFQKIPEGYSARRSNQTSEIRIYACLLYTSDAADDLLCAGANAFHPNHRNAFRVLGTEDYTAALFTPGVHHILVFHFV